MYKYVIRLKSLKEVDEGKMYVVRLDCCKSDLLAKTALKHFWCDWTAGGFI